MKTAIFIADTRAWLIGTLLMQIKLKSPKTFDEAIIYHMGLSQNDMDVMNSIMPCRFVHYESPLPSELFKTESFKKFTSISFARYEMFNYLDEFDKIVYSDTDVCLQKTLDELLTKVDEKGLAITVEGNTDNSNERPDFCLTNFTKQIADYNMSEYLYPSGCIAISKKLKNWELFRDWCYEKTVQYSKVLRLPDQGIINLLIQEFDLDIEILSTKKYACYPKYGKDCSDSVFVHSWGERKFWNNWYLNQQYPQWAEGYKSWVQQGGSRQENEILPDVTVLIPTYKPDLNYFKESLDSIVNQKKYHGGRYENYEIIIIAEPFEQDKIQKFVDSYNDKRIRLIFNEKRLGISASLNKGIRLAKGRYIARIDDDDISDEKRLYKQMLILDNSNAHLCTSNYEYFGDMESKRIQRGGKYAHALSLITCPFDHPTVMFDKAFFVKHNLWYDESKYYVEDWDLWSRAFESGLKVVSIPEYLLKHRWHDSQAGQSEATYRIMNIQAGQNFLKLGITLSESQMDAVRLWTGKILLGRQIDLYRIFKRALKANRKYKIYDQKALYKVFKLRLNEAFMGKMSNYPILFLYFKNRFNKFLKLFHNKKDKDWKILEKKMLTTRTDNASITFSDKNFKNNKHIFIIGTSTHENIGDAAISLAEIEFAKKYFPDYQVVEVPMYEYSSWLDGLKNHTSSEDLFWGIGGGNLGSRYLYDENIRRSFLSEFKNNPSVIFPQSIYFANTKEGKKELKNSAKVYNSHTNLLMVQRDPLSHKTAIENFSQAKQVLFPDIVCSLNYDKNYERKGILSCIRDVKDESGLTEAEYNRVLEIIANTGEKITYRQNRHHSMIEICEREKIVYNELDLFAHHKVAVTDRLHGLIFAVVTHTPCVAIKSEDHKIKEFMHFLKDSNAVVFIDKDLDALPNAISQMLSVDKPSYPTWEGYYKDLAKLIREESEKK